VLGNVTPLVTILFVRGSAILVRFFFLLCCLKFFDLSDFGRYMALVGGATLGGYLLGLESGTLLSRKLIKGPSPHTLGRLKSFLQLYQMLSLVVIIAALVLGYFKVELTFLIFGLAVVSEAMFFELRKVLVALGKIYSAALVEFVKNSILVGILFILNSVDGFTVGNMFIGFATTSFLLSTYLTGSIWISLNMKEISGSFSFPFEWRNFPILVHGGISILIEISGRFYFIAVDDPETAGIYSIFSGLVFVIPLLVYSGTMSVYFREAGERFLSGSVEYLNFCRKFMAHSIIIYIGCVVFLLAIFNPVVQLLGKAGLLEYHDEFLFLLIVPIVYIVDSRYFYPLHFNGSDWQIAISSLGGFTFFSSIVGISMFLGSLNLQGFILILLLSTGISAFLKWLYCRKYLGIYCGHSKKTV